VARRRGSALALAALAAVVASAVALAPGLDWRVSLPVTLLLVLFLPGYAVTLAVMPGGVHDTPTMLVLSVGTSLGIAVIAGIVLGLSAPGIGTGSWVVLLLAITFVSLIVASVRSHGLQEPAPAARTEPRTSRRLRVVQALCFGVALFVTAWSGAIAIRAVEDQPRSGFTQLWIQPTANPDTVLVGIHNAEHRQLNADIRLTIGDALQTEWSATIDDGWTWQATATLPGFAAGAQPVQATLTLAENPDVPYRYVTLWPK